MENKDSGKLGLVACIAILTGGCIGSAIFSLSGLTMYYAGPAAIITWIVAAIILGCYGVQVAELSVRYPDILSFPIINRICVIYRIIHSASPFIIS